MTLHALLLGCATNGIVDVSVDLQRMRGVVERSTPDTSIVVLPAATRPQIVDAFGALCDRVRPADGVVVYYTGHGLRLRDQATGETCYAIVPVGADDPPDAFGYVLQEELSAWFWRLSRTTHNLTWVADCCHAGGVLRGVRLIKGLEERRRQFAALRRGLLATLPPEALDLDSNPHVIRANASASDRKAFADPADGGLFTRALVQSLEELDYRPIVCEDLARLVVRKLAPERQLPAFAGPVRRWWLSSTCAPLRSFPTAVLHGRGTLLAGGLLLDHRVGDRYVVKGPDQAVLASLVITKVLAHRSQCEPEGHLGVSLPVGATAVLRDTKVARATVEFPPGTPSRDPLVTAVTASGYIARSGSATASASAPASAPTSAPASAPTSAPLIATIVVEAGARFVVLPSGSRIDAGPATDPSDAICELLDGLARQATLLALPCSDPGLLASKYALEPTPDRSAVQLVNRSPLKIYASAFELRPGGAIELVTRDQPDGEAVAPQQSLVIRPPRDDQAPSPRRLVFVVTDTRIDLRAWTHENPAAPEVTRGGESLWFGVHPVDL